MGGGGRGAYGSDTAGVSGEHLDPNRETKATGNSVANKFFDRYGIAVTPRARNTTRGALEDFTNGSSWVLDQFPTLKDDVDLIDYNSRKRGSSAYASLVRTEDGIPRVSLTMSAGYTPSGYGWYSDYFGGFTEGRGSQPASMSTGAHETAHALGQHLNNMEVRKMTGLKNWERYNEAVSAWSEGKAEAGIIQRAYKRVGKKIGKSLSEATRSISDYATTNASEAFAEAFGEVYARGNSASTFARAIVDETIRTYRSMTK